MIHFVFDAILLGLTLAVVFGFGPAFFTLVQTSIHRGFKSAAFFSLGVMLNDALMVCLCVLTSIQVVMKPENEFYFSLGAGVILILFGFFTFIRKVDDEKSMIQERAEDLVPVKTNTPHWYTFLGKGFVLNILNPFVWFFWISTVAVASGNMNGEKGRLMIFFALTLGTYFLVDLLKAYAAASLKRFFNANRIRIMNKIIGISLIVFGVYFIVRGIVS
jgi:Putative threonine efflux protein